MPCRAICRTVSCDLSIEKFSYCLEVAHKQAIAAWHGYHVEGTHKEHLQGRALLG